MKKVAIFVLTIYVLTLSACFMAFAATPGWWNSLVRTDPDGSVHSCCGEGDALYADWEVVGGKLVATVTGGGPRNLAWAPIGRRYELPNHFAIDGKGNPTGKDILFVNQFTLEPICLVTGAMI